MFFVCLFEELIKKNVKKTLPLRKKAVYSSKGHEKLYHFVFLSFIVVGGA